MKKKLSVLVLLLVISLSLPIMASAQESDSEVLPDKIETIKTDNGKLIEIKHFDTIEKVEKYKEQVMSQMADYQSNIEVPEVPINQIQPMALLTSYKYNGASGYIGRDFDVKVYKNRTGKSITQQPTVTRTVGNSVNISLKAEADFKKVFKASTKVDFGKTQTKTFKEEFGKITIPNNKQLEIWTNQIAKVHSFTEKNVFGSDRKFNAYQAVDSWEYDIIIGPIRNPY
ncbi:hypothetical protein [Ornithinibacillus sp. FSL M8-0202]|uniref:hypothetical protein n=1 Tax=Ornithinibacillus sp. FSL M8-0202 TaxID=2921616 RepID=UPI0030D34D1D